jgi:hypothetical protein
MMSGKTTRRAFLAVELFFFSRSTMTRTAPALRERGEFDV